jgi:hypothetical protein
MTRKTLRSGSFEFVIKPNGVEILRDLNAMQSEVVGLIPWQTLAQLMELKNDAYGNRRPD